MYHPSRTQFAAASFSFLCCLISWTIPSPGIGADVQEALVQAIQAGDLAAAKSAVEQGADVNRPGPFHRTVLHRAAYHAPDAIVEWLPAQGADPNAKTTADYSYKWTYVAWDVKGMEELVPEGVTPVAYARKKHRSHQWVDQKYRDFAELLANRGAVEPKWWQFWH